MAPTKESIVVLTTSVGEDLVIRSGPTNDEVRSFVKTAVKRFINGLPGGPDPELPAYQVYSARRYPDELSYLFKTHGGTSIKIEDLL